mgnify:CR=1 FL=1
MKKLLALLMALTLTFQLVTPVFADTEEAETTAATEAVLETEAPTEAPAEAPTTDAAVPPTETEPTETAAATTAPVTTETTQAVETTAPTETTEVTEETTAPTEETVPVLDEGVLSGECGANLTWTLDESTGTLTISGTGAMWDYDYDYSAYTTAPWCSLSYSTLVLEPGITSIGNCAFTGSDISCDLNIPEGVTAIGKDAFRNCNIGELTLPESLKTIGYGAFAFAGDRAIRIPAGVTTIGENSLAGYPRSAITVDPANRSFKVIGKGLYNASGTRLLAVVQGDGTFTVPDAVSQVDSNTFWNCKYTAIHLGAKVPAQFVAYQVSPFNAAFSLKAITVSGSNPNYKAVDGVLFSKDGKKLISYPCQKADTSYTVPDGVETILEWALNGCDNLAELILPEGVKTVGEKAAIECLNLTSVTLPASLRELGDQAFGYTWEGNTISNLTIRGYTGSAAESYALENGFSFESIGEISETASGTCGKNLKWKMMGTTLTISGTGAMDNYNWDKPAPWQELEVTKLVLEEGITSIGNHAFRGSNINISELSLPSTLKTIGEEAASFLFACDTLHIPAGVTSIGNNAFSGKAWDEITVDPENRAFRVVDGGLYNAAGTRLLAVENGTGEFTVPDTVAKIDTYAFWNCDYSAIHLGAKIPGGFEANPTLTGARNLEAITVSKSNPNLKSEDGVLFSADGKRLLHYPCKKQGESYTIPEGVEVLGSGAFNENSYLTSLTLPEGLKEINYQAIFWCDNLKSITIPASVTKLGWWAVGYTENDKWDVVPMTDFTIYGHGDGVAKTYAEENKFRYVDLDIRSGECGENLTWNLNKGLLTISGEGTMWEFSPENPAPWQDSAAAIKTADIKKDVASIGSDAFKGCTNLKEVYYGGSKTEWRELDIGDGNECLTQATIHYGCGADAVSTEIRPVETDCLTSGSKLTLTAWTLPGGKKVKAKWSLSEDSKAYASISSSGVLTAKAVSEVQNITVIAAPTDGSLEARKEIQILPKITVKQTEKFNLFYGNGKAKLAITGGQVASARFVEPSDFVLEDSDGQFYIRLAEGASAKPKTKVTLEITLPGCDTPIKQTLTVATTNAAPKLKLNPTASIVNTTLTSSLTVETAILGTEDTLTARSATKGVTASADNGILTLTLDTLKTTTATVYLKGSDWAKEIKLTHKITVTGKTPTVKLSAKGKLDVLNLASEIVYTPKLTNATGTITDVHLEGQDANLFNAEVVDGLVHLKLANPGGAYSTKKTYKVTPIVTLLGKDITGPTLSVKVTQSTLKLAKIPNQTVYQSQTAPLAVKLTVTSPASAEIGDVQLNAKTTAALRNALENAGGIQVDEATVSFPSKAFTALKPGRYTVILDVTPANAASDTKHIQARFTLTVQK